MSQTDLTYGKDTENLVRTGKNNKVTSFLFKNFQYTAVGMLIIYRLMHDRDIKIVITSSGTTTGTGKTTLAIILARWIQEVSNELFGHSKEWNPRETAFMNVWEYLQKYKESDRGDVLITDELEYLADNRRSTSNENVYFSQAWGMLRYKNCVTIGTAPGIHSLDKRIPQNADIWINVVYTGRANTYYLTVNDFTGLPIKKRMKKNGYKESILWDELTNDPDYQYLKSLKDEKGVPGITKNENPNEETLTESDINEAKRDIKTDIVLELLDKQDELGLTQHDIGDIVGYSQQNVYKIKREN